jgi:hypothetical protein
MTFASHANGMAGQPGPPQQIRNRQEAELNAVAWMRAWGYADAQVTQAGPDGGVDVRSAYALAQVKYVAAAVGRPDIQRFVGAAAGEPGKRLIFFSGSGYTATAVDYANSAGVALFQYALDGSVRPVNTAAPAMGGGPVAYGGAQPALTFPVRTVDWKARLSRGGWYFALTILSVGYLTAIPFWHARFKLRRPSLQRTAIAYTVADVVMFVLMGLAPKDAAGNVVGALGNALVGIVVIIGAISVVSGCLKLRPLRREIWPRPGDDAADPAMARAVAQRARRVEARKLHSQDPAMARELGIGRPDLGRGYDDGGLVDLNTAPAAVIAGVCGLDGRSAEDIVAARTRRGGYFNVGEVLMDVDLPPAAQEELRERAVF